MKFFRSIKEKYASCPIFLLLLFPSILSFTLTTQRHRPSLMPQSSVVSAPSQASRHRLVGRSLSQSGKNGLQTYPPLSREEIESLLANIPVYAVTQKDGGIVLLNEKDNDNAIAYFFFNPQTASNMFKGIREKQKDSPDWNVVSYSLGLIWFELLQRYEPKGADIDNVSRRSVIDGVEYRLVPDAIELDGARKILLQQAEGGDRGLPPVFLSGFNEIPVFLERRLRLQSEDGKEVFPMHFALQDLVETCQQFTATGQYNAVYDVADLHFLITQMQSEATVDFRQVVFSAPSPPKETSQPKDQTKQQPKAEDDGTFKPTLQSDWSD